MYSNLAIAFNNSLLAEGGEDRGDGASWTTGPSWSQVPLHELLASRWLRGLDGSGNRDGGSRVDTSRTPGPSWTYLPLFLARRSGWGGHSQSLKSQSCVISKRQGRHMKQKQLWKIIVPHGPSNPGFEPATHQSHVQLSTEQPGLPQEQLIVRISGAY